MTEAPTLVGPWTDEEKASIKRALHRYQISAAGITATCYRVTGFALYVLVDDARPWKIYSTRSFDALIGRLAKGRHRWPSYEGA